MIDYFIKANNKDELDLLLEQCGYMMDGEYITASENHALIVLGQISRPVGEIEIDGILEVQIEILDGYHANIRKLDDEPLCDELQPYLVVPQNPVNIWF